MGHLYDAARDFKNAVPVLRDSYAFVRRAYLRARNRRRYDTTYGGRLAAETDIYRDVVDIHELLPPIFHYWSNRYLRPMLEEYGFSNPDEFFAKFLRESAILRGRASPVFLSIGSGNCDTEVRVAKLLRASGLDAFAIECLDLNPSMLARGRELADREGVGAHIATIEGDFNQWTSTKPYDAVMANQSLHHVVDLEGLFDEVRCSLSGGGFFIVNDIIGRNGHLRWSEALVEVRRFWRELPAAYRYNRQLDRHERTYRNWDCSAEGFEGIRAQDILPLLMARFDFRLFIGFANVIDVFVDRSFGHNFDADAEWDRDFVDRVHAFDEEGLRTGALTPTHMLGVLVVDKCGEPPVCSRGLTPEKSVRR